MRRGQVWSMDYTAGFLIFTLSLLLAVSFLFRISLTENEGNFLQETETVAGRLMSEGYPIGWQTDDVIIPGLFAEGRLSSRKATRLATLASGGVSGYQRAKGLIGTRYEYAIILEDLDGTTIPFDNHCFIGSPDVTYDVTFTNETRDAAYYSRGTDVLKNGMAALGATIYENTSLPTLLDELWRYDVIVFEEPRFNQTAIPYDGEKVEALERYVRRGGILFLIGDLGLEPFGMAVLPLITNTVNGTTNESILNISDQQLSGITAGFTLNGSDIVGENDRYTRLADGPDFAAFFTAGDGDVYYLGSLDGVRDSDGRPLDETLLDAINLTISYESANCTNITLPETNDLVAQRRLVAYDGRIAALNVNVWRLG